MDDKRIYIGFSNNAPKWLYNAVGVCILCLFVMALIFFGVIIFKVITL